MTTTTPLFHDGVMRRLILAVLLALIAISVSAQQKSLAERLGYPADSRLLIVQTDLGMMHSINRAGFEALEKKLVTSATILVPCPWFPEVAQFARNHPDLDFGLHLALNSEWRPYRWGPVSPRAAVPSLIGADGYFPPLETDVYKNAKPAEVEQEFRAQIQKAQNAGVRVTHVDSHMSAVFGSPALFEIYKKVADEFGLLYLLPRTSKLAENAPSNAILIDRDIQMKPRIPASEWLDWYRRELAALPPGVYQLTVHLGYDDEEARGATEGRDWGAKWRQTDWDVVRSPEFQQMLRDQKFVLISWGDLAKAARSTP
ncbi:MAG TPA: polysaccharide deacetylase family protein [Terriglobales bacterium]|nr:polysaccharide deacetylase family protein [Terriglobales bacterium]